MRKTEDEIKDPKEIESIIQQAQVCRIAFSMGNIPYIVPMNFGYQANCLYFHGATAGQKLDMLRQNDQVCFEIDINDQIVKAPGAFVPGVPNTAVSSASGRLSSSKIGRKNQRP